MKKVLIIFLLATLGMTAQVKETRNTGVFSRVKVSQGIELTYSISTTPKITVETDSKETLQWVRTQVKGSVLEVYIESEKNSWGKGKSRRFKNVKVSVQGPHLNAVAVSSSAKFIGKDALKADDFTLEASSSGYFKGEVKAKNCVVAVSSSADVKADIQASDRLEIKTSSSSDFSGAVSAAKLKLSASSSSAMKLTGDVKSAVAEMSSSAKIEAGDLKLRELKASASSSSTGVFYVSEKIDASAASSAYINYSGNPTQVNVKNSSSGKVNKK
ncbi:GIN domain-containing protein [Flavobacterium sp. JP2137]|uniref:GIN domain-containing protein n=1 Tax=Flavobacterium sp. JP2137 TaxID=3414510 RepID=UPI003D2FB925